MKKHYKLTIEPITAVHIGTGQELTPLDYKILIAKSNGVPVMRYMRYSSDSILHRIATDSVKMNEFDRISTQKDMRLYFDFFNKNCDANEDRLYLCAMTDEFKETYKRNLEKDPLNNKAAVLEIFREGSSPNPVIPGSSIKGAVRTAVLNYFLQNLDEENYRKLESDFSHLRNPGDKAKFDKTIQKALLNNESKKDFAKTDAFRALEITDCRFGAKDSQIVGMIKNISPDRRRTGELKAIEKLQIQAEAIKGFLMDSSRTAECSLRLNADLVKDGVTKSIKIHDIINACNDFYWNEFVDEYNKFYKDATEKVAIVARLRKELQKITGTPNQFILRVGRWSQCESVTLEGFSAPKTSKDKKTGMPKKYGTTRTVMDYNGEYLPMGWCKCTVEEID